eukprot:gene38140-50011_t
MLAAAGWPLSELWHKEIADIIGLDSILAAEGKELCEIKNGRLAMLEFVSGIPVVEQTPFFFGDPIL